MKINGILQNYSCLITSSIDNSFIILFPPPPPQLLVSITSTGRSFFMWGCRNRRLIRFVAWAARGGFVRVNHHAVIFRTRVQVMLLRRSRLHVKQLGGKNAFAPRLNWETVKLPRLKAAWHITQITVSLEGFPTSEGRPPHFSSPPHPSLSRSLFSILQCFSHGYSSHCMRYGVFALEIYSCGMAAWHTLKDKFNVSWKCSSQTPRASGVHKDIQQFHMVCLISVMAMTRLDFF